MKRVLTKIILALAIGGFIYVIAAGGEGVSNILDGIDGSTSEDNTGALSKIKDSVLDNFPLDANENELSISEDYIDNENQDSYEEEGNNQEGPLSNLLNNFSDENDLAIEQSNTEESTTTNNQINNNENKATTSPESIIEQTSNLPKFTSICFPTIKRICDEGGCEETNPNATFTLINDNEGVVHQCINESCTALNTISQKFEDYTNYRAPERPGLVLGKSTTNIDSNQTNFIELETKKAQVTIKYGYCLEQ